MKLTKDGRTIEVIEEGDASGYRERIALMSKVVGLHLPQDLAEARYYPLEDEWSIYCTGFGRMIPVQSEASESREIIEAAGFEYVDEAEMIKVYTDDKYDYYIGVDDDGWHIYNIAPVGSVVSDSAGYHDREYIEKIKGRKFPEEVL